MVCLIGGGVGAGVRMIRLIVVRLIGADVGFLVGLLLVGLLLVA